MKAFCCIAVAAGLLISLPAVAQQGSGGSTINYNLWSGSQGTSDSYGTATGLALSSSGASFDKGSHMRLNPANAGGSGGAGSGIGGRDMLSSITTSNAAAMTSGSGYSQVQTSGYSGGSFSGLSGRAR